MDRKNTSSVIVMDPFIVPTLIRYVDRYHWSFNRARRLINMYYGTDYTNRELRRLYKENRLG